MSDERLEKWLRKQGGMSLTFWLKTSTIQKGHLYKKIPPLFPLEKSNKIKERGEKMKDEKIKQMIEENPSLQLIFEITIDARLEIIENEHEKSILHLNVINKKLTEEQYYFFVEELKKISS